jgi:hypothetical protein
MTTLRNRGLLKTQGGYSFMNRIYFVRLVGIFCLSLAIASLLRVIDVHSSLAAVQCDILKWHFDGTDAKITNVVGVQATISSVPPPALCGEVWSDSSIWVLLGSGDLLNGCALAQVGYGRSIDHPKIKVFAEYGIDCDGMIPPIVMFKAPPGNHKYQVQYKRPPVAAKRKIHMWFDNIRVAKTNFDPEVAWGGQPWDEEWNGETHDEGDDVPGTPNVPAFFTLMRHKTCKACAWEIPVDLVLRSTSNRYAFKWNAADNFQIWTK